MSKMTKESSGGGPGVGTGWFLGMFSTMGIALFSTLVPPEIKLSTDMRPKTVAVYDINGDGLEDVALRDGTVQIKKQDGSYASSLGEMRRQELRAVHDKYTFREETERNSLDNLDYRVKTGRYVIGGNE
jgi:hypothetical protein